MTDDAVVLSPLAAFLLVLCEAGLLGDKYGPASRPVPQTLRCRCCHSPRTRIKALRVIPDGLGPITGFEGRCRVCGAESRYELPAVFREAA